MPDDASHSPFEAINADRSGRAEVRVRKPEAARLVEAIESRPR